MENKELIMRLESLRDVIKVLNEESRTSNTSDKNDWILHNVCRKYCIKFTGAPRLLGGSADSCSTCPLEFVTDESVDSYFDETINQLKLLNIIDNDD